MSVFRPTVENIDDFGVPIVCPGCGHRERRDGLGRRDKEFLLAVTEYHHLWEEYVELQKVDEILSAFPGTTHPLLVEKLPAGRTGRCDDAAVDEILNRDPALKERLHGSYFRFETRYRWVADQVWWPVKLIASRRIACGACNHRYMVLPDDYYHSIG